MNSTVVLLLVLFGIKHFIADYLLQVTYMFEQKGIYGAEGGIHHAAVHSILTFLVLIFVNVNFITAVELAIADGVLHYHIDWAKLQVNKGLTAADRMFWMWVGVDHGLHYLTYIGIIYAVS